MKYRIIETLLVLIIVLVASLVYVQSNELEYVFKYLSIIPLLLFYDRLFYRRWQLVVILFFCKYRVSFPFCE